MKLTKLGHRLGSAIDFVSVKCRWVAIAAVVVVFVVVVVDVIGRYIFNHPIKGSTDMNELLLVIIAFAPMAYTQVMKEHVHVTLVVDRFSPGARAVSEAVGFFGGALLYGFIAWNLGKRALELTLGTSVLTSVSPILAIPHAPFVYLAALFSLIYCLVSLADSIRAVTKVRGQRAVDS